MTDNYIQLPKENILRLKIRTDEGIETGEELVFDFNDVDLPLKYQELIEQDKKNRRNFNNKMLLIEKRQDVKGKKLLSKNEEDSIIALKEYIKAQIQAYNLFLGENGVQKLLNGRKIGYETLNEINEIVFKQIKPYVDKNLIDIRKAIINKYKDVKPQENVIE